MKLREANSTGFAEGALGAGDAFGEKFLLEGGDFLLVLALELVVDGIHEPDIELVAVLMAVPLEDGRLSLDVLHEFAGRNGLHLFLAVDGFEQFLEVAEDAVLLAG